MSESSAFAAGPAPHRADAAAPRWSWPLPRPHRVVRGYDAPEHAWSAGHRGIDIDASERAAVLAPDDGVVHFSGVVVDRPVLSLEHDGGVLSSFEPVVATVKPGSRVARGQKIGRLDSGHGDCGPCLHLGARIGGSYVSPLLLLGALRPSVLLPTRHLP